MELLSVGTSKFQYDDWICEIYYVNWQTILLYLISIGLRFSSIFFNLILAIEYNSIGDNTFFVWTLLCIFIPMIVTSGVQLSLYYDDKKKSKNDTNKKWYEIIFYVIVIPFFFRYWNSLYFASLCKWYELKKNKLEQKRYYDYMIQSNSDTALIRIFECFLETAPQKTLQLSIMIPFINTTRSQQRSVIISLVSMAWCVASYHKAIRFARGDKNDISIVGVVSQFLWQMGITVSRILAISVVAHLFPIWILLACGIHILIMTTWIFFFDRCPFFEENKIVNFLFSFSLGIVFIFNYISPKDGRTLYRYIFFYCVIGVENFISILLAIFYGDEMYLNIFYIISYIIFGSFTIGLLLMLLYYGCFHPNAIHKNGII